MSIFRSTQSDKKGASIKAGASIETPGTLDTSAHNVLAMVNNILSKNIKVHTDNKNPNTK